MVRACPHSASGTGMSRQVWFYPHTNQMYPITRRVCTLHRRAPCCASLPWVWVSEVQRRQGDHALAEDLLDAAARAAAAALDDPSTVHHLTHCTSPQGFCRSFASR